MNHPGSVFVPVQVRYCTVYLHTVGLTPGFTYLVSCDDTGVGFASPVMVYQGPVAWLTVESPMAFGQLMGPQVFFLMAAIPVPPAGRASRSWSPSFTAPCPLIRLVVPVTALGLGWNWSSPATGVPPQVGLLSLYFIEI